MDNDNADDEVILQSDSSSESENEFLGFDISDEKRAIGRTQTNASFCNCTEKEK